MPRDFYEVLGVGRSASEDELKKAYRRLARQLHPDANQTDPGSEEKFKEVSLAYEVLSDPERRRRYDMFGPESIRGTGAQPGFGGDAGFSTGGMGDIFDALFGGRSPFGSSPFGGGARRGPVRGQDAEASLSIAFEDAVFGASRELSVKIPVLCEACGGSGAREGTTAASCAACGGTGELRRVRQSILGQVVTASPCSPCGGTGEVIPSPCPACRGEGRVTTERVYTVEIPAGVDDGATLRLTGRGPAGPRGGPPGDLYVHLRVSSDDRFARDGYDLVHVMKVPMTQAALGTKLELRTLDGVEEIAVTAGTQSGRTIRLRHKGVPHIGGKQRGDLLVQIEVETPTDLTREQEELLRRLATERGEEVVAVEPGLRSKIKSAFK